MYVIQVFCESGKDIIIRNGYIELLIMHINSNCDFLGLGKFYENFTNYIIYKYVRGCVSS